MRPNLYSPILLLVAGIAAGTCFGQPVLRLKTRQIHGDASAVVHQIDTPVPFRSGHLLLQFAQPVPAETLRALASRGVHVLNGIPENGLLVTLDHSVSLEALGAIYAAPLAPSDKISPIITANPSKWEGHFLVEFHSDVAPGDARALLLRLGLTVNDNPDLLPEHLMITVDAPAAVTSTLAAVAAQDEVNYVFPASRQLAHAIPSRPYAAPLTTTGAVTQNIPTYGNGWAGPGHGSATVGYVFGQMTAQLPQSQSEAAIQKAMAQWSKVAQVTWQQGSNPTANGTVNIFFATYAHGDAYPFTGPGRRAGPHVLSRASQSGADRRRHALQRFGDLAHRQQHGSV